MTDYSEHGALPVEDAASQDAPTVDEVLERQRQEYPEKAESSTLRQEFTDAGRSALAAGGDATERDSRPGVDVKGPNPA